MKIYRKNIYGLTLAFIILCGLLINMQLNMKIVYAKQSNEGKLTIALDPGHGGEEDGACYYGMKEKDINLKLAKMVKYGLEEYEGIEVVLTRDSDEAVSLGDRALRAKEKNADILISLHQNASASHKSKGTTIYISTAEQYREKLFEMADYLLGEFEALGLQNDGTIARVTQMGGRRADGTFDDYYGVLRHGYNNGMPSLLIEHCFMDSKEDHEYLKTEEGIAQLAQADVNGIASFYDLKRKDGSTHVKKHAEKYGATTKGLQLGYYEPPQITEIKLTGYNGISPAIATYQASVKDSAGVDSLSMVYKNGHGETAFVSLELEEPLKTGTYTLKGYVPEWLKTGDYHLSYIGVHNVAGYEAGYNYAAGEMIGFGKCRWTNNFSYMGEADIYVKEQGSVEWVQSRWRAYKNCIGVRE